ncbi:MAG: hypothetical protein V2A63_04975, partial [Patescibacteria group bacterium]
MQKIIDEIIVELVALDPEFAKMESEIRILANKMLAARPDSAIDSKFKKELKNKLLARADELKSAHPNSSFNFFKMQKFFFALAGAAVAI